MLETQIIKWSKFHRLATPLHNHNVKSCFFPISLMHFYINYKTSSYRSTVTHHSYKIRSLYTSKRFSTFISMCRKKPRYCAAPSSRLPLHYFDFYHLPIKFWILLHTCILLWHPRFISPLLFSAVNSLFSMSMRTELWGVTSTTTTKRARALQKTGTRTYVCQL